MEAESAFLQLATVLEMSDAQTAEHLEDLYATLRGDMQLQQARDARCRRAYSSRPGRTPVSDERPSQVHFNKGRRGWGLDALRQYAPEYRGRFRLHWVAVQREHLVWSSDVDCDINSLLASTMDSAERAL